MLVELAGFGYLGGAAGTWWESWWGESRSAAASTARAVVWPAALTVSAAGRVRAARSRRDHARVVAANEQLERELGLAPPAGRLETPDRWAGEYPQEEEELRRRRREALRAAEPPMLDSSGRAVENPRSIPYETGDTLAGRPRKGKRGG